MEVIVRLSFRGDQWQGCHYRGGAAAASFSGLSAPPQWTQAAALTSDSRPKVVHDLIVSPDQ
jgi:hypothetical protein